MGDPYQVCDVASFLNVNVVAAQSSAFLLLTADLTLVAPHVPFPSFAATLDGGGLTISGLTTTLGTDVGMIGTLSGRVSNLTLTGVQVTGTNAGALAGRMTSGSIDNVVVTNFGRPSTVHGASVAGGLVGEMTGGTITNVHVSGDVTSPYAAAGGVVGRVIGGALADVLVDGTVTVTSGFGAAGGVVGDLHAGTIQRATIMGPLVATGGLAASVGGAVGRAQMGTSTLVEIRSVGMVKGWGCTGGLVGNTTVGSNLTASDIRMDAAVEQVGSPGFGYVSVAGVVGCAGGAALQLNRTLVTGVLTSDEQGRALVGGVGAVGFTEAYYVSTVVGVMDPHPGDKSEAAARSAAPYSSSWTVWTFAAGLYPELTNVP